MKDVLERIVGYNRILIRNGAVPPFDSEAISWRISHDEAVGTAILCSLRGFGDSDELATYYLASLIESGEDPKAEIILIDNPQTPGFVSRVAVKRSDGRIEEPWFKKRENTP